MRATTVGWRRGLAVADLEVGEFAPAPHSLPVTIRVDLTEGSPAEKTPQGIPNADPYCRGSSSCHAAATRANMGSTTGTSLLCKMSAQKQCTSLMARCNCRKQSETSSKHPAVSSCAALQSRGGRGATPKHLSSCVPNVAKFGTAPGPAFGQLPSAPWSSKMEISRSRPPEGRHTQDQLQTPQTVAGPESSLSGLRPNTSAILRRACEDMPSPNKKQCGLGVQGSPCPPANRAPDKHTHPPRLSKARQEKGSGRCVALLAPVQENAARKSRSLPFPAPTQPPPASAASRVRTTSCWGTPRPRKRASDSASLPGRLRVLASLPQISRAAPPIS